MNLPEVSIFCVFCRIKSVYIPGYLGGGGGGGLIGMSSKVWVSVRR